MKTNTTTAASCDDRLDAKEAMLSNESSEHIETRLIHGAHAPDPDTGATAASIEQSTAYAYESAEALEDVFAGRAPGYVYSRIGNPTVVSFERRMADIEGGLGAVACASGMAAISTAVLALAGAGDEIVSSKSVFGGTWSLFEQTLSRCGIVTHFVESTDVDAYRRAVSDRTRLIFVETMGNPKLDVPDLKAIAAIAREQGVVLMVDNTLTTPALCRPGMLGADVVIHSTSKYINGHGNAIGGVIIDCGSADWSHPRYAHLHQWHARARRQAWLAYLRNTIRRDLGGCMAPFTAFLMNMGFETLAVRMERQCDNAASVARFLDGESRVREVRYPGLEGHPDHSTAQRQFGGRYGALITLRLKDQPQCFRFINGLKYASNLANLGDARTLVIHPASTFCREMDPVLRSSIGAGEDWVRLSIGLEHADDLIADIRQSLEGME